MKKVMNWMLAAILLCGTSAVVSSCGDDDDDNNKEAQLTPNTYEVTLSAVLPECTADLFSLDFEYTNAAGQPNNIVVKAGNKSDEMPEAMKPIFNERLEFIRGLDTSNKHPEKWNEYDRLIVKTFSFEIPAGKSFTYKATMKARFNDFKRPSGEIYYFVEPFVWVGAKRISGNSQDNSAFTEELSFTSPSVADTVTISDMQAIYDGKVIVNMTRTMN